jgi:hypothetical protein
MPHPRYYPPNSKMSGLRLDDVDQAIITRIRALHPYLKGDAQAIRLALHFWNDHQPEAQPPAPPRDINITRDP